jgi:hypothetical protein
MTTALEWPADAEWIHSPTAACLEDERRHWASVEQAAGLDVWVEAQAQLESFETWPLEDLIAELEAVQTLTPDQIDVIDELAHEIERRRAA